MLSNEQIHYKESSMPMLHNTVRTPSDGIISQLLYISLVFVLD